MSRDTENFSMYSLMSTSDQRVAVREQELGQRPRQLRLADAGRAAEDEAADGPVRVLQPRAAPPDGPADGLDGLVLADDPRCSSSSMFTSFWDSASRRRVRGMPVQRRR
jgi:hypothetical protein